jgi:nucleoside-diphosphate-sugar epimerase
VADVPKHIVVAGGGGFIGSNLCEALVRNGHTVTCLDNFVTGRRKNLEALSDWPTFELIETDIVESVPELEGIDQIFHLASPASPPGYQGLPVETIRVNTEGTRNLLDLALRNSARFLFASTSEAYGDPLEHPQREDYRGNVSSVGPRSMYDESKRCGEALTMAYERTLGVDCRIVRIFNTYGPNSDPEDGRLVPNLICQALSGKAMTVYGNGRQTRSLCYVDDLVQGLRLAMDTTEVRGLVLNLGNPAERSVYEFAKLIRRITGSSSPIVHCEPAVGDDPQRRRPDITRAKSMLGWEPTVDLQDGLAATVDYFRNEIQATAAVSA